MKILLRLLCFCFFCLFTPVRWVLAADTISLTVHEAPVKEILHSLAELSGRSIITDPQVTGTLSINLQEVPFREALDLVTRSRGLCCQQEGNTIIVSTREQMARNFGRLSIHPLDYIAAKETAETLKPLFPSLTWDLNSNALLLQGSPAEEERLRQTLRTLDQPTKQITLEARILSLRKEASKELGLQWHWGSLPASRDSGTSVETKYGGRIHLGHGYGTNFEAKLSALCQEGKARILATPRIITLPGREASIFIGDHIPVVTEKVTNSTTSTTTEYVDAGIRLSYTPLLSNDGMITAKVHTEVSTPTLIAELKNYRIASRTADTHVRMREKETLVIGGLISEEEQKRLEGIPLLSKIPLLGEFFKYRSSSKNKTEVCMLLTPYISEPGKGPSIFKAPPGALPAPETGGEPVP